MNGPGSKVNEFPRARGRASEGRQALFAVISVVGALSGALSVGCDLAKEAPPLSQVRPVERPPPSPAPVNLKKAALVGTTPGLSATETPSAVEVVFGGDVVPQARVLGERPSELLKSALPLLGADGFVFNLEGPVGSRRAVPKDKTTLAFATPPDWLGQLLSVSRATAFGAANNHACDLEQDGPAATHAFAEEQKTIALGVEQGSAWRARVVAESHGKRVCALAWTTFLNDERKRHDTCRKGRGDLVVARASLDAEGFRSIRRIVADDATWSGCGARVAYVHGGIEYRAQSAKMMYLANTIAPNVDAIVFAHTHVPDGVERLAPEGPSRRRSVPVFRSLGNLLSNQGAAWSEGMATTLLGDHGAGDPIRTVWTRVAMLSRLRFEFATDAAGTNTVPLVRYGYDLAFLDRSETHPVLTPLGADSPVAEQLRRGTYGALVDGECRRSSAKDAALPCSAD